MKKILPVNYQCDIIGECVHSYKISVLSQHERYMDWLMNHIDYKIIYNVGQFYDFEKDIRLSTYADILDMTEEKYWNFDGENIISYIQYLIDNNQYVSIDGNLSEENGGIDYIHELFIFGYDDVEEVFFNGTKYTDRIYEGQLSFSDFLDLYKRARRYYLHHPEEYITRSEKYCYPFMSFCCKKSPSITIDYSRFMSELQALLCGCRCVKVVYDWDMNREGETDYEWLGGTINMWFYEYIRKENFDIERYIQNLYRYIEYRKIVMKRLYYVLDVFHIRNEYVNPANIKELEVCFALTLKYRQDQNPKTLANIRERFKKLYVEDIKFHNYFYNVLQKILK